MKKATPTFTETHTMYNLFPLMAKTALLAAIPKTIDVVYASFFEKKKTEEIKQIRRRRLKSVDMTPLTQQHYDIVIQRHQEMKNYNRYRPMKERFTTQNLADGLNFEFGLDKSITAYSNFWRGAVARNSLPTGQPLKLNIPSGGRYITLIK